MTPHDAEDRIEATVRELLPLTYARVEKRKGGNVADAFEARMMALPSFGQQIAVEAKPPLPDV